MYACVDVFHDTIRVPIDRIVYVAIDVFVIKCDQSELYQLVDLNPCFRMRPLVHNLKMSLSQIVMPLDARL